MNENQTRILIAVGGVVLGAIISMVLIHHHMNEWREDTDTDTMMHHGDEMSAQVDGMQNSLSGKTGDAFDQAFLSEMITHHQGAVQMAEAALQNAKHQEIKDLAQKIISAQNAETKEMQEWQKSWYGK